MEMTSISDVAGNLGSPTVATIAGKRLKFKLIDQHVKSAVEQHCLHVARDRVLSEAPQVDEHVFRMMYQAFMDAEACGAYRWGGRVSTEFLKSAPGVRFLCEQLCPEVAGLWDKLETDTDELSKLMAVVREVVEKSFPAAKKKGTVMTT